MCEAFALAGNEVRLFAQAESADSDPYAAYGVRPVFEVVRHRLTGTPRVRQWRYGWQAVNEVRKHQPDVIYGRHLPAMTLASFLGIPLLYEVHQQRSGRGSRLENWLFRRPSFAQLTTISDALRREYLTRHPVLAKKRVLVAHSAANTDTRASNPPARSANDPLRIGYTGHLYPGKGIETITALATRLPTFEFHVLGGTTDSLLPWSNPAGRPPNLTLHGHVRPCEVAEWQRQMDVLILPCQHRVSSAGGKDISAWTSPLKLFEYLASGRPVVASDLPVLREVLQDGVNSLLVPPGDIEAWAEALQRLTDPDMRATLGAGGRQSVEDGHTWSHRAQQVLQGVCQTTERNFVTSSFHDHRTETGSLLNVR